MTSSNTSLHARPLRWALAAVIGAGLLLGSTTASAALLFDCPVDASRINVADNLEPDELDYGWFTYDLPTEIFPHGLSLTGTRHRKIIVFVDGNITFGQHNTEHTPTPMPWFDGAMLAVFWADVDLRDGFGPPTIPNPGTVEICVDTENTRLLVTWKAVTYWPSISMDQFDATALNSVQMVLSPSDWTCEIGNRTEVGLNMEYRYNDCNWFAGGDSGGRDGVCDDAQATCHPAVAGYDLGNGVDYENLPGSGTSDICAELLAGSTPGSQPGVYKYKLGEDRDCGNGSLETCEECDDASGNSDSEPDACRSDCQLAYCGDSVVDTGEDCDLGILNSDTMPTVCLTTCAWSPVVAPVFKFAGSGFIKSCNTGRELPSAPLGLLLLAALGLIWRRRRRR